MRSVLGAEISGSVATAGGRLLGFRADRVDLDDEGHPLLVDFKTSASALTTLKTSKSVRRDMLQAISRGRGLQAAAYALGACGDGQARGRYAYLDPDAGDEIANELKSDDPALGAEFARAVESAMAAWDSGELPPRVIDADTGKEPRLCDYCEVSDACRRGESGARQRLSAWGEAAATAHVDGKRVWRVVLDRHEDAR